jgi:hypothetical protein
MEIKSVLAAKFEWTREQALTVARKYLVDCVWCSVRLEGIPATFPQTEAIVNGAVSVGLDQTSVQIIINLREAWRFILEPCKLDYALDFGMICYLNRILGHGVFYLAGELRKVPVTLNGTKWIPPIPDPLSAPVAVSVVLQEESPTDKAVKIMLHLMRNQLFIDGNKRTATFAANQILLQNGAGLLTIGEDCLYEFGQLLRDFYETDNQSELERFIYDKCITGIPF